MKQLGRRKEMEKRDKDAEVKGISSGDPVAYPVWASDATWSQRGVLQ